MKIWQLLNLFVFQAQNSHSGVNIHGMGRQSFSGKIQYGTLGLNQRSQQNTVAIDWEAQDTRVNERLWDYRDSTAAKCWRKLSCCGFALFLQENRIMGSIDDLEASNAGERLQFVILANIGVWAYWRKSLPLSFQRVGLSPRFQKVRLLFFFSERRCHSGGLKKWSQATTLSYRKLAVGL